jgi:hypothetical protein
MQSAAVKCERDYSTLWSDTTPTTLEMAGWVRDFMNNFFWLFARQDRRKLSRSLSLFLNPHQKHLNAGDVGHPEGITDPEVTTAVQDRPRSEWGRVFALYLAAFLGAFIIGLTVIGMTATEQSTMTAATIPRAKAAESASGTTTPIREA